MKAGFPSQIVIGEDRKEARNKYKSERGDGKYEIYKYYYEPAELKELVEKTFGRVKVLQPLHYELICIAENVKTRNINMRLKSVIFDFDRTLVNLLDFTDLNSARILVAKSYLKNKVSKALIAKHNRGPFRLFYNVYYELAPTCPKGKLKEIQLEASKSLEKFEVEGAFKAELMLGAYETLRWIKKRGIRVGIVSTNSRSSIEVAASRLEIADFIDVVIGRNPLPERMKPHPYQVLGCLRKLACKPDETMMVGDGWRWLQ